MAEVIKGCGVDIIEIDRIARAIKKPRFIQRIYTAEEQQLLHSRPVQSWAARFAAKEAVMKALGCGWQQGVRFRDIEILQEQSGKPVARLKGQAWEIAHTQGVTAIHLSLSHNRTVAIAYAVCVGGG